MNQHDLSNELLTNTFNGMPCVRKGSDANQSHSFRSWRIDTMCGESQTGKNLSQDGVSLHPCGGFESLGWGSRVRFCTPGCTDGMFAVHTEVVISCFHYPVWFQAVGDVILAPSLSSKGLSFCVGRPQPTQTTSVNTDLAAFLAICH